MLQITGFKKDIPQGVKVRYKLLQQSDPNLQPAEQWRQNFDAVYRLGEGQILQRIAPPFIPERKEYYKREMTRQASSNPEPPTFLVFKWDRQLKSWALGYTPSNISQGKDGGCPLGMLVYYMLPDSENKTIGGSKELQEFPIDGDWIIRDGAAPEQILTAFEDILKNDFGKNFHFVKRQTQQEGKPVEKWFVEEANSVLAVQRKNSP